MSAIAKMQRLKRSLQRIWETRYPLFIFGFAPPKYEIPVFTYHDVEHSDFNSDLTYLHENGYCTLTLDEYFERSRSRTSIDKCVLLTFDDARISFWDVAYPLLQKHNAHATLFVPTYWINKQAQQVSPGHKSQVNFMAWDQLRECAANDLIDVQSHAHRHALVYTSNVLIDFVSPELLDKFDMYDWPMRRIDGKDVLGYPALGTPVYEATPLLSAEYRVIENSETTRQCMHEVATNGGVEFFTTPDWRSRLSRIHCQNEKTHQTHKLGAQEFRALVMSEFEQSQNNFSRELGYKPTFFAYPWMLGSKLSMDLAVEHGIKAVFGVGIDYKKISNLNPPPYAFGRLKCDWLKFLPGKGRNTIYKVLPGKLSQFFKTQHLAH